MTLPKISVIVPVYNRKSFLKQCLRSIEATRYPNLEIIIIDDGSSDGSWELAMELAQSDPKRLFIFHHPKHRNLGISASRNLGIHKSTGTYLAFLDSDDRYEPSRFEVCINKLECNVGLFAVYEPVCLYKDLQKINHSCKDSSTAQATCGLVPGIKTINATDLNTLEWLNLNNWWHTSGITVRRRFIERTGDFHLDLPVAEDTEMWMRLAASGRIRCAQSKKSVAKVIRHSSGHSWDQFNDSQRSRLYRKALLYCRNSVAMKPGLFLPEAPKALEKRYAQAVLDEILHLSRVPNILGVASILLEAVLHQPRLLMSKCLWVNIMMGIYGLL